jgi:hypothetical protein
VSSMPHVVSPAEFEMAVAELLRREGFAAVEHVGGSGDLGVDVRARDVDGRLVVVQCKRYRPNAAIGSPDIQRFFGMIVHHGAARGLFVTTARFTTAAHVLAAERDIRLINGTEFANLLAKHGMPALATAREDEPPAPPAISTAPTLPSGPVPPIRRQSSFDGPAIESNESIIARVESPFVKAAVTGIEDWVASLNRPDLVVQRTRRHYRKVRYRGREVLFYYFAKHWVYGVLEDPTSDDIALLQKRLAKPEEVRPHPGDDIRFHLINDHDLNVVKAIILRRIGLLS